MKKVIVFLIAAMLLALPVRAQDAPSVSAAASVVMEAESGRVLFEKNAHSPRLIASTTKILTALVVLEHCGTDEDVIIKPEWTNIEGSSMYLTAGKSYTVQQLLYGLLLASGNDAAVALAGHCAGSTEAFAALMNEKARALGCENSHFVNPNGLDDPEHYASAYDLALITRDALKNEDFRSIVSQSSATVGEMTYRNHNRLLQMYDGVFGVKTGYTMAAGRSLVSCCEREGLTLICVTLSAPDDWDDHMSLYNWAYERWRMEDLSDRVCASVPVVGGEEDSVPLAAEDALRVFCRAGDSICMEYELPRFVFAGFARGDLAGRAVVYVNGEAAASCPLFYTVSTSPTEQPLSRWERFSRFVKLAGRNIYSF